ncbi:xanthine dehydrogenase isoform X2 [Adelges cooleyi]|uniref:xanthine dehydrogenase isoform X2 n=1 Tax=Adelges cooleyi TaxID=133065 RepID=UPI0021807181|nr:xanthine dehydrogenase isoform X2 [Adelges cooleyi]
MEKSTSILVFFVNGKKVVESKADPQWTLLYYLRNKLSLMGTKLGCAEGGCGACTVVISKYDRMNNQPLHLAVNACLCPVVSIHGCAVITVEGIGSTKTKLHPVQERMAASHGSQCGFCTPGIVMSIYAMLRALDRPPNDKDLEYALQGNLCRCTGYRPILQGLRTLMSEDYIISNRCAMGELCCKKTKIFEDHPTDTFDASEFSPYDPTQEPIFPPELIINKRYDEEYLIFRGNKITWYRPTTLLELLELKNKFPKCRLIVGNTEVGVEVKFKNCQYPVMIQPTKIPELNVIQVSEKGLTVGAAVTIQKFETELSYLAMNMPDYKIQVVKALLDIIPWFASKQIRNVGCIAGNIVTGSPISDLNPILLAARCQLKVESLRNRQRLLTMDSLFFTGYRTNSILADEVVIDLFIPFTTKKTFFKAFKQSRRKEDDIALVNAAFYIEISENVVRDVEIVYGGMSATAIFANKSKSFLIGNQWSENILNEVYLKLLQDLPLAPNAPGGMVLYRKTLALRYAVDNLHDSRVPKYAQYFQITPHSQSLDDPVGRPFVHASAKQQTTGEAIYCDDLPHLTGELFLAVKTSTHSHAKITTIDYSKALSHPGVITIVDEKDLPGDRNMVGVTPLKDDYVFAREKVFYFGQIICAVVAVDQLVAQEAVHLIRVEYEELRPIVTIEEAIEEQRFHNGRCSYWEKGSVEQGFKESKHSLKGTLRMGGQEHFYLETQSCMVIPSSEHNEIEVISSTQSLSELQGIVAHCLNIPANRVVCKTKRIGGGFGGKETRAFITTAPCAVAAIKTGKPIRCMLDRHEDMLITGGRHPFLCQYNVGFNGDGKILALDVTAYNNAGYSLDLSAETMERCVAHIANVYYVPNLKVSGYACATNLPSNTAFRGFGAPQGMYFAEAIVERITKEFEINPIAVRELNFFQDGQITHYNQMVPSFTVKHCWEEVIKRSKYESKLNEIERFNKKNRWKKRGISAIPTMYGIAYAGHSKFLNQAGVLLHVYLDGSVLLAHGGVEMGQGLHTKMIQVASRGLGIPPGMIHIKETSTDKVANMSPTAGSFSSDLNGMAVLDDIFQNACEVLNKRLEPYKKQNPNGSWKEWVNSAYFDKISLWAQGFYANNVVGSTTEQGTVNHYMYFTNGAVVSCVEIDCLTGDHEVLSTDIVMDVGQSLNPAIDVGQIEGAFMQGYGLFTLEELVYSPKGMLYTRGPGTYKIPGFADIPVEFTVSLLKGSDNPRAVYSSKAIGEPPLFLSASVYFAIKNAVYEARKDAGITGYFRLDPPATVEKIRMACQDHITNKLQLTDNVENIDCPWNTVV